MTGKISFTALFLISVTLSVMAESVTPYSGSRIFWDSQTRTTVFSSGGYGRIIELQDGRLMAVCESSGINIAFSSDMGDSWTSSTKIVSNSNDTPNCVPDLLQLSDGTIVVVYNPRPNSPYTTDRLFGIRCKRSTDNGETWSDEINIYDADYLSDNGCWEPSLLELPSGELQVYFADESPFTSSSEQQISMCRSYDGGETWGDSERIAYRSGYRDGMPSPKLLADEETIVVAIEDNGTGYGSFMPSIVRCSLENNWVNRYVSGTSSNRTLALDFDYCSTSVVGGAPYICVLPSGETVLSWQSTYEHGTNLTMLSFVGDEDAKNFKAMSSPFITSSTDVCQWNSVAVVDTGVVVAVGGMNGAIEMIKGYPRNLLQAPYGKPDINGTLSSSECYYGKRATQILMGSDLGGRATADFAYDQDSLYFAAMVSDATKVKSGSRTDGVYLFIDADNLSETSPQEGIYGFFFKRDTTYVAYYGSNGAWKTNTSGEINLAVGTKTSYYIIEAAIPWSLLGKTEAPTGQRMAATVEIQDVRSSSTITETIPDAQRAASWTWMEFRLQDMTETDGISQPEVKQQGKPSVTVRCNNGQVMVSGGGERIKSVSIFGADGRAVGTYGCSGTSLTLNNIAAKGFALVKVTLADGTSVCKKVIM